MAEWGISREDLGELDATRLIGAYIRRKRWEAKIQAFEIWKLLGEAMADGKTGESGKSEGRRRVGPKEFMREAGVKF